MRSFELMREEGDVVLGLFLDFSKAFDTVNHEILFTKLEHYGVRDKSLELFKSYLSCRQQFVEYNGISSSKRTIVCGVPQGSILGPLLFLVYINDLAHASSKIFSILFADDSNLFLSGKDPNELIKTMKEELIHIVKWLNYTQIKSTDSVIESDKLSFSLIYVTICVAGLIYD